jgi:hypothetical protein
MVSVEQVHLLAAVGGNVELESGGDGGFWQVFERCFEKKLDHAVWRGPGREWMGVEPTGARCSRPPTDFEDRGTHRGTSTPRIDW